MATLKKRLPQNVAGEFYVDATCIDCGACRGLAPECFGETDSHSFVYSQPRSPAEARHALHALLACPTGSIGTLHPNSAREVMADFPLLVDQGVYYNGFTSPKSYGAHSYLIQHPAGNWLVDSPKYLPHLIERFEAMGGIRFIFLTHQDDVAEAARYAERFGSERIIHQLDAHAMPDAERLLTGDAPIEVVPGFRVIPTPGHTRGHCVLLYDDRFLFAGDHLWGNPAERTLGASKSVCWYSWGEQIRSMERLLDTRFEWVLPGHGDRLHLDASVMHARLAELLARMRERA